ncbi:beta-galactosidase [Anaerolinea thermophila]|uniref:Glycosyl hydrolase n=1 Tax=Anaerolinea thermophila (strain DSM 14523 / JCM 11388 / NBRC 100420 / UNI-1) TaxID=926569 RepID=E8N0A6_ANATU|nr:beta-galactosidase [Anaerolinea thermophila]BAJ64655.1 putative glycosyl hydrolase [Anaerolinea thermophila UNI-1]
MAQFSVKQGQFWLDGKPLLLQAGEFHYFRTPPDQWEHRLNLLKQAGFNAVASYIPWLWHQPEPEWVDLDGHTHPMRNLQGFLDLASSMGLWIIPRPGPYIMAETINEGIPPWVFVRSPQVALIGQDGKPQNIVSYLHPDFLAWAREWYRAVFGVLVPRQVTRGGKILLVQLDNEMGMIHWVRNLLDTHPDTLARFAAYLREKDTLPDNAPMDGLEEFLHRQLQNPDVEHGGWVVEEYRRFYRTYLRQYAEWLVDCAHSFGLEVPPVINIHGFGNGGKTFPIGLSQLSEVMQIPGMLSATDVYPLGIGEGNFHQLLLVNEMTRALHHPEQPLFSIEFQAGGNQDFGGAQTSFYDLHTRLCVSTGMRAINHYLFFDGENHPILSPVKRHDWGHPVRKDGTLRRHYHRYPRLSRVLQTYGEALTLAKPRTVTTIGFVLDDFMTEVNNSFTRLQTDVLTHQREVILFDFIARGLALTHRPFDALELSRAPLDATRTPTLWVMMEKQCDVPVQHKLVEYVRQGGRLILAGRLCEEDFQHHPCTVLKDALGIRAVHDAEPFRGETIHIMDVLDIPVSFVERFEGDFDEVFAHTVQGEIVGFVRSLGKGRVMMLGAALAANTLEDLAVFERMAQRMECSPLFEMSDWLDVRLSEGEKGKFLFVNNYQDDPVEALISLSGKPLFGGEPVRLPARRGLILPLDWQVRPGLRVDDSTGEVTGVFETEDSLILQVEPTDSTMQLTLSGYRVAEGKTLGMSPSGQVRVRTYSGRIVLQKA